MPSNPRPCQAKDPRVCPYHSSAAKSNTLVLLADLKTAHDSYKLTQQAPQPGMDSAFDAWETYKQAETRYYATDEGLEQLELLLDGSHITEDHYNQIKDRALTLRYNEEANVQPVEKWGQKQARNLKPFPVKAYTSKPVNGVYLISSMPEKAGAYLNQFKWDSKSGHVYIEVEDENGEQDVDYTTMIGKADNLDGALYKAFEWYRKRGGLI